jgi:hypothetical protein
LRGVKDDFIDILNPMGARDVSQLSYDYIYDLFKRNSRGTSKPRKGPRYMVAKITKTFGEESLKKILEIS